MVQCVEHPLTLLIIPILIGDMNNLIVLHLIMIITSNHVFDLLHLNIFQFLTDGIHLQQIQDLQNSM